MRDSASIHAAGLQRRLGKTGDCSSMTMAGGMVKNGLTPVSCQHSDRSLITAGFES
jgi:hypothetical protein